MWYRINHACTSPPGGVPFRQRGEDFLAESVTQSRFVLPEDSKLGLRDQICELVSAAINSQVLSPDKRLPSCREMAEQLGVSRNTVFAAYGRLIDLGLVIARDRSGYYVNPTDTGRCGLWKQRRSLCRCVFSSPDSI